MAFIFNGFGSVSIREGDAWGTSYPAAWVFASPKVCTYLRRGPPRVWMSRNILNGEVQRAPSDKRC